MNVPVSMTTREPRPAEGEAILRGCLSEFPYILLTVTGRCMEPVLEEGQSVRLSNASPRLGDVVLVKHPDGLRLHRLIWRLPFRSRGWRTKGDHSFLADPSVSREDILGVAEAAAPRWANLLAALRSLAAAAVCKMWGHPPLRRER